MKKLNQILCIFFIAISAIFLAGCNQNAPTENQRMVTKNGTLKILLMIQKME